MTCNDCILINPIPTCSEQWVIDQAVDTAYDGDTLIFRLTNIATGSMITNDTEPVEPDGSVVILIEDFIAELMDHTYKLELLDPNTLNPITITMGEEEACCVEFTTFPFTAESINFSNVGCDV